MLNISFYRWSKIFTDIIVWPMDKSMNNDQRDENIPLMKMEKNKGKFEYQRTISSIKDPQVSLSPAKNYRFANYRMNFGYFTLVLCNVFLIEFDLLGSNIRSSQEWRYWSFQRSCKWNSCKWWIQGKKRKQENCRHRITIWGRKWQNFATGGCWWRKGWSSSGNHFGDIL